ncbi:hypothetical protein G4B88_025769 [Cannabis sativa]|uniref:Retrotransposon gag domain-containing protein n=2 Tax=Cannabis sativa TaxID=3483 RepID=A0A7J6DN36_CANSA|nr:hypothetical protein G4B88_025769 [Cannabis sativa]
MSWLYASLSDSMLGQIVGFTTAAEIWVSLERTYSAASFARSSEFRTALQNLKKDRLSASAYLQKLKTLCNTLASVGEPISFQEHLTYLLNGLGPEYNAFVTPILARPVKPTIEERPKNPSLQATSQPRFSSHPQPNRPPNIPSFHQPRHNYPTPPRSPTPWLPSGSTRPTSRPPRCQICFKTGHTSQVSLATKTMKSTTVSLVEHACSMAMVIIMTMILTGDATTVPSPSQPTPPTPFPAPSPLQMVEIPLQSGGEHYHFPPKFMEDYGIWNPTPYFGGGNAAPIPHSYVVKETCKDSSSKMVSKEKS